jgi:cytochrome c551/c552
MPALKQSNWAASIAIAVMAGPLTAAPQSPVALVNQYCVGCHNQKVRTAGVSLEGLDLTKVGENAGTWEKVLRKVSAGQMPPAGLPHPSAADSAAFAKILGDELDRAAAANPNPGHPTIHRLNRAEYSNAIRDLLALDIKPGTRLPADDTGYGFDNIGDVLSLSPVLIERYMSVARMVSRLAVGDTNIKPEVTEFEPPKAPQRTTAVLGGRGRASDDLPFDSTGGLSIPYHFPVDADYVIKIKLPSPPAAGDGPAPEPKILELRLPVKAGTRKVGVTFLSENAVPEVVAGLRGGGGFSRPPTPPSSMAKLDLRLDGARLQLYDVQQTGASPRFSTVTIAGPYNVQGTGKTPSRERIFVCTPASVKDQGPCARKILSTLARRAYRRPITDSDLNPLLAFYETGRREVGFDNGIRMALRAMLVAPAFLFRIERDPRGSAPGTVYRVSDFELASRLSFFLWSSIPDDELLKLAEQGKLKDPVTLSQEVNRMLDDRRAKAFVNNFAGQWLYLRNLSQVKPDQDAFPEFDANLRQAFQRETELFFEAVMRENRPVTDLLSADFTYLNQRLAEHYGIPNIYGTQFRRVALKDPNRGGLLGQGSILTVTSYPNRTSVVQRGKWVLENLLGTPPPPPPPDIPPLEAHAKDGKLLTMRQQMEQHRVNPTCAACHSRMDPIGFSLENYNGVGAWRAKDAGNVIDATGKLPDGTTFQGPGGLRNLLLTAHRDEFISTFTEKLMTYALGRGLEHYDMPAMRAVVRDAAAQNTSIPALISSVVKSPQFQMRRTRQ